MKLFHMYVLGPRTHLTMEIYADRQEMVEKFADVNRKPILDGIGFWDHQMDGFSHPEARLDDYRMAIVEIRDAEDLVIECTGDCHLNNPMGGHLIMGEVSLKANVDPFFHQAMMDKIMETMASEQKTKKDTEVARLEAMWAR